MLKSGRLVTLIALWLLAGIAAAAYAQATAGEVRKIEYLLMRLGKMSDVKFIRNGRAYSAKEATGHLRMKWRKAGERVKTADDFINICASRSYLTGQPYRISFSDGRTEDAAAVLRRLLKERPG